MADKWYIDLFERLGKNYLDYPFVRGTQQEIEFLITEVPLRCTDRILDVGCGPGRHALGLANLGYSTVGLDISPRMINIAREKATELNLDCQFVVGDARALPWQEEFDVAYSLCEGAHSLMENDWENDKVLASVLGALKPGGRFILSVLSAAHFFTHLPEGELMDLKTCQGHWREHFTAESGEPEEMDCNNRYYTFPEIKLRLELIGFRDVEGYGCQPGAFSKQPIGFEDHEIMLFSRKPTKQREDAC